MPLIIRYQSKFYLNLNESVLISDEIYSEIWKKIFDKTQKRQKQISVFWSKLLDLKSQSHS